MAGSGRISSSMRRAFPRSIISQLWSKPGQPAYGMSAVGSDKLTPGAQLLIDAVDRNDPRPLYVSIWGGPNTLAQALWHVRETRSDLKR